MGDDRTFVAAAQKLARIPLMGAPGHPGRHRSHRLRPLPGRQPELSVYNLSAGTERTYQPGSVGNTPGVPITWVTQNSL